MTSPTPRSVCLNLSAVGREDLRGQIKAAIEEAGEIATDFTAFWPRFLGQDPGPLPPRTLVVGDLHRIVAHYRSSRRHRWIAAVRRTRPMFLALVRTRRDEAVASLMDNLIRDSDLRIVVSRCTRSGRELRCGLAAALQALDPDALLKVQYAPGQGAVWVEFGDGLAGMATWAELSIGDLENCLLAESVSVGEGGWTLEFLRTDGELLEIDGAAIRGVLDPQRRLDLTRSESLSDRTVGVRLKEARESVGMTQVELGRRAGIDQAVISRLEQGKHSPRIDTLHRIAGALGQTVPRILLGA